MIIINNSNTDIIDRNVNGLLYTIKGGDSLQIDDEVGAVLLEVYGFLSIEGQQTPLENVVEEVSTPSAEENVNEPQQRRRRVKKNEQI